MTISLIDPLSRVVRNESIPTGEIDGELVALDLDRGECFGLDSVGLAIWRLAADPISVAQIADRLVVDYAVDRPTCLAQISPFIGQLVAANLLRLVPG